MTQSFVLYRLERRDQEPSRVGFVIGRRFGTIAKRNRLRRRLRAACRLLWHRLKPGYNLVFVARDALPGMSGHALLDQVEAVLKREGLLEPNEGEER